MSIWAILPVKPLRLGKSRLAGLLPDEERAALNRCLFEQTLALLQGQKLIQQVVVVSRDPQVLALARARRARTVQENNPSTLNRAVEMGTILVARHSQAGVLVVPADLPLLESADLEQMLKLAERPPAVVIAPDRRGQGTNALLVYPAGLMGYSFGRGSFERHCQMARQSGARLEVVQNPRLALDLDLPEDLALMRSGNWPEQDVMQATKGEICHD